MSKLLYQNFEVGGGIHNGLPVGSIIPFASDLIIPNGFLICAGQSVSRTMYPDLFQVLGTRYGSGDGETTFNLPNLINGEFLEGSSVAGTSKTPGLPNITGRIYLNGSNGYAIGGWNASSGALIHDPNSAEYYKVTSSSIKQSSPSFAIDASRSSSVYGNSDTVQPKSLTVIYIIKAFDSLELDSGVLDLTQLSNDLSLRLQRHQVPAFNKLIEITTSQTWYAPYNGWYKFTLKGAGGGGGGGHYHVSGSGFYGGGGAGGEGGITLAYEKLTQSDSVSIVIGAGGTAGAKDKIGGAGGNTTITIGNIVYISGGGNGGGHEYSGGTGGLGGSGTFYGNSGNPGCGLACSPGGTVQVRGGIGKLWYGGGGSGGMGSTSGGTDISAAGNSGAPGVVWIEYFDPTL